MRQYTLSDFESVGDRTCPTCGRHDFASPTGMFRHHGKVHGTSLVERRFWHYVDVKGDDECWEWKAATKDNEYGVFTVDSENVYAHRYSYELENGPLDDEYVLHSCDNPPCVNPRHLSKGDQFDNMRDAAEKGRTASGGGVSWAKLSEDDVAEIRRRYAEEDVSYRELGKEYGVSLQHIGHIVIGTRRSSMGDTLATDG